MHSHRPHATSQPAITVLTHNYRYMVHADRDASMVHCSLKTDAKKKSGNPPQTTACTSQGFFMCDEGWSHAIAFEKGRSTRYRSRHPRSRVKLLCPTPTTGLKKGREHQKRRETAIMPDANGIGHSVPTHRGKRF